MTVSMRTEVIYVLEYSSRTQQMRSAQRRCRVVPDVDVVHFITRFEGFLSEVRYNINVDDFDHTCCTIFCSLHFNPNSIIIMNEYHLCVSTALSPCSMLPDWLLCYESGITVSGAH